MFGVCSRIGDFVAYVDNILWEDWLTKIKTLIHYRKLIINDDSTHSEIYIYIYIYIYIVKLIIDPKFWSLYLLGALGKGLSGLSDLKL